MNRNSNFLKLVAVLAVGLATGLSFWAFKPVQQVTTTKVEQVGGSGGPDISSPYISWGGISIFNAVDNFMYGTQTASTTVCALEAPLATSTLEMISVQPTLSTSSAVVYHISTSTTAYATSTDITSWTIPANGTDAEVWYPSTNSAIIAPSVVATSSTDIRKHSWIVVSVTGAGTGGTGQAGGGAGVTNKGVCKTMFDVISPSF